MATDPSPIDDPHPLIDRAIEGMEMRGVSMPGPNGPVMGYQWRLKVRVFATPTTPETVESMPWVFGSEEAVDQMLRAWQDYLGTQGHWARRQAPPPMKLG